ARRSDLAPLRVDVNLVLVPVTVTDRSGKIISGLDKSRFKVFEEGVPQPIVAFSTEDLPASIGLVLDVSGSMKQKLETARSFVQALLAGTDSGDEALFLTCANRPDVQADLTHNIDSLQSILQSARPGGWTALVDSVYLTIDRMKAARNSRKVLVIVSDGQDNHSRYSKPELRSKAIESEAQIYSVATPDPPGFRKAIELVEANRGIAFLSDLAHSTGGLYFQIDSAASISLAAEKISTALHHQYLIGYYSPDPSRNGLRRIQVKLDVPDLRLYARNVYYATTP
ncbi:MAG: VWA domain-containing protein, partial [Acidobacteriia bacterium]|nr:VWA domain-containing protein [Terriglobia bacterium]